MPPSSMLPLIEGGDKPLPLPPNDLQVDDLVIFKQNNHLIFHRLIYLHPRQTFFLTKGDSNPYPDKIIAKSQILAKSHQIKRQNKIIDINSIYQLQSTIYLNHLSKLVKSFNKRKIKFILLKGIPLHLYINKQIPHRIFADNDLLIQPKDLAPAKAILSQLGFKPTISYTNASQINFIKPTIPFPIIIDLHLEPAISFTKIPSLSQLTPSQPLTTYLFKHTQTFKHHDIDFPILQNEALLIYLLLHLFHHNYKGYHRFQLITNLIKNKHINWSLFTQSLTSLNYQNLVYPGIKLIKQLYLPRLEIPQLKPSLLAKILTSYLLKQPISYFFTDQNRYQAARQRLILTLLLAPTPLSTKIRQLAKKDVIISTLSYKLNTQSNPRHVHNPRNR